MEPKWKATRENIGVFPRPVPKIQVGVSPELHRHLVDANVTIHNMAIDIGYSVGFPATIVNEDGCIEQQDDWAALVDDAREGDVLQVMPTDCVKEVIIWVPVYPEAN